jgi:hypothetical protein
MEKLATVKSSNDSATLAVVILQHGYAWDNDVRSVSLEAKRCIGADSESLERQWLSSPASAKRSNNM